MTPALVHVSDHVYWLPPDGRTDRPSLAAVAGAEATLLLDIGNSPAHTQAMLDALAAAGVRPPRYAAVTHWHWDHTFGAAALGDVAYFAHRATAAELRLQAGYDWSRAALDRRVEVGLELAFCRDMLAAEYGDTSSVQIRLPDVVYDGGLTFDLGGVSVEVAHVGGDHASDSCVMYVPADRLLFCGDCLYDAIYAPQRHYTLRRVLPLLERVLAWDALHYLQGHHEEAVGRAELVAWADDLRALGQAVAAHDGDVLAVQATITAGALVLNDPLNVEYVETFAAGLPYEKS